MKICGERAVNQIWKIAGSPKNYLGKVPHGITVGGYYIYLLWRGGEQLGYLSILISLSITPTNTDKSEIMERDRCTVLNSS